MEKGTRLFVRVNDRDKKRWQRLAKKRKLSQIIRTAMERLEIDVASGRFVFDEKRAK